jgi:hypothetical protein
VLPSLASESRRQDGKAAMLQELQEVANASQAREFTSRFLYMYFIRFIGPFFTTREAFELDSDDGEDEDNEPMDGSRSDELPHCWYGNGDQRGYVDKNGM